MYTGTMDILRTLFFQTTAIAATTPARLNVSKFGGFSDYAYTDVLGNILLVLNGTAIPLCLGVFLLGTFFYTTSVGNEDQKNRGKDMMVGAVKGIAVIAGADILISSVFYLGGWN